MVAVREADVLGFGKDFKAEVIAFAAGTRGFGAAERLSQIAHVLAVDEHHAGIDAGMVFVNSQNVRDLRQPFGGTKASGTGREGNHFSFEVFAEAKNVCLSYGNHPIPRWGV